MADSLKYSTFFMASHQILKCGSNIAKMKQAVDQFIHKFLYHSDVKSNNQNDRNFYPYIGNIRFLKTYHIEGPRGKRNFWIENKDERPAIEIEKISLQQSGYSQFIVEQGNALAYNHAVFADIHNLCVSGWRNPYLCV